jgi:tellurite resistance protein TehA-like permease
MGIENDAKDFLVVIVQTVSSLILWFLINILLGIYLQYGMFKGTPTLINILYYLFFAVGCFLLFRYFKKRWRKIKFD